MDFRQPISYLFPAIIITMAGVLVFKIYKKGKGRIRFSCILFIIYIEILMQTAFFSREPGSRQQIDLNLFGTWGQTAIAHAYFIENKTIVITGDTAPLDIVAEKAKDCDILLHEVEYAAGISCREPKWQKYHREVHTLSTDLAQVAKKANPKLLVTYHRIYHMNIQDNRKNLAAEMAWRDEAILDEIREAGYEGYVVNGKDLDVF